MDGVGDLSNANSIFYADFFAPPAKKTSKNKKKRGRPHPNNFPEKLEGQEDDIERTMNAVHRDLFEEEGKYGICLLYIIYTNSALDDDVSEDDMSDLDPSDPLSRKSTNERKQMRLAKEIQRLEAANVAKRQWQLSGEATAHARPLNSLLEEDLDFERAGKPIPIVSEKTGEEIEALIKRRILAQEFDEGEFACYNSVVVANVSYSIEKTTR